MPEDNPLATVHSLVLLIPAVSTVCATVFSVVLFARYRRKGGGLHLLWWGLGFVTFAFGTFTEAYTSILGWHPLVFRLWYVSGAFLGGYPLAQGSIYLLMNRRFAHGSAAVVMSVVAVGAVLVFLSPLDLSQVETHRLHGGVLEWSWIRLLTPFINLYAVVFLVGGAIYSAWLFSRRPTLRHRYVGNILIAIGGILPGIGGSLTRFGYVEALYITELMAILLIYAGYQKCISGKPVPARGETISVSGAAVAQADG